MRLTQKGPRRWFKVLTVLLMPLAAMWLVVSEAHGQGTLAPLGLLINGSGSVSPYQAGQLLEVGQDYEMTAAPDSGFLFISWQPVNVFTFTEYTVDPSGNPNPPIVSTVDSPVDTFYYTPTLDFTLQPVTTIYDVPGVRIVTQSTAWQANFSPVPEPSDAALIICGLTVLLLARGRRLPFAGPAPKGH